MNTRKILLSALCCVCLCGSAKQINPLTQAMLDGYATLLEENPNDYLTLYERASQYYRLDSYDNALSDIKKAISCTPSKEKEQLASEYSLMADIYTQREQYAEALDAVNQALTATPSSYKLLYMKGNICLHLGQTQEARTAFTAMQRIKTRSSEALFGLAHAAILEGKTDEATSYIADAENMSPGNYLTYCRMGDLHKLLKMTRRAAADYLNAFSLSSDSDRPMRSIMELAKEDYSAVDEAIDYALQKTTNVVPLYFLQGNAANAAGRYDDAYNAYRELEASVSAEEGRSLYADIAEISLHRGELTDADNYASKAMMNKSDLRNNLLKAQIEMCRGNYTSAKMYVNNAMAEDPTNHEALMYAAEAAYFLGDNATAQKYLNEAIMNDATASDALLFRGFIHETAGDIKAATADYTRASTLPAATPEEQTRKAIAQVKAGKTLDASSTISPVYTRSETDARCAYLSALYSLSLGNEADAKRLLDKAVELGFDDRYLLKYYKLPLLSVTKLRSNP